MKKLSLVLLSVFLLASGSSAQDPRQLVLANSPAYEAAAIPLRSSSPQQYEFSQAVLGDVLRLLAHDAGISFFSLPTEADGADTLVTFNITSSPFKALETLASANGVALIYDEGIWYMRPANDKELIGRTYFIKYNSLESVTSSGGGSGGGGGSSSGLNTGISLQGNTSTFTVEPSALLEDIRELLDLQTTGFSANIAGSVTVDSLGQTVAPATLINDQSLMTSNNTNSSTGKVIWNSDTNSLYVVATRQQHQWIEAYLASADQPQSLIALEVKFFETSKDPKEQFGLDWTGTLGKGYEGVFFTPDPPAAGTPATPRAAGDAENIFGLVNPNRLGDFAAPTTAVLSLDDVRVRLRALVDDSKTTTVSYPRMLTLNNREVVLRSVINQPVLASSSSTSVGAGATTTSSVDYLPIGTVLNILPKTMSDDQILLNISLTISSILTTENIEGNPFPVASSRVYSAPVLVGSGYTVAIGGLDEADESVSNVGVPILGRIPLFGTAFSYRDRAKSRKNLLMMITPTLVDSRGGGLPDEPQAVVRQTPEKTAKPRIFADGTLVQDISEFPQALEALSNELDVLTQTVREGRSSKQVIEKLAELNEATELTVRKIRLTIEQNPDSWEELRPYEIGFVEMTDRVGRIRRDSKKSDYDRKFPFNF